MTLFPLTETPPSRARSLFALLVALGMGALIVWAFATDQMESTVGGVLALILVAVFVFAIGRELLKPSADAAVRMAVEGAPVAAIGDESLPPGEGPSVRLDVFDVDSPPQLGWRAAALTLTPTEQARKGLLGLAVPLSIFLVVGLALVGGRGAPTSRNLAEEPLSPPESARSKKSERSASGCGAPS